MPVKHNADDRISKVIKNQSMFNNYENSDKLEWVCPKENKGEIQQVVTKKEDINVWKKMTMHPPTMGAYPQLGPTGRRRLEAQLPPGTMTTTKPETIMGETAKTHLQTSKDALGQEHKPVYSTSKKVISVSRAASNFMTPTGKPLASLEWANNFSQTPGTTSVKVKDKLKWLVDTPALINSDKFQDVLKYLKGIDSVTDNTTELTRALLSLTTYFETLIQKLFGEHKGKFENSEFFKALVADHIKEMGLGSTPSTVGGLQPSRKNFSEEGKQHNVT